MRISSFKFKLRKSFTLLEMLVVIGIIAVLVSIGISSYSTVQKKARDAKRRSDLSSIRTAFEQYYSICNFKYPTDIPAAGTDLIASSADCTALSADVNIMTIPSDPLGGSFVCTSCSITGSFYTICPADLGGGKYLETEDCNSVNESCCVSNQQ